MHGLVVASGLGLDLGTEACGLVLGIVELREPVRHLLAADEQLEAVGDARLGVRFARQRRDLDRIVGDEGRLDEAVLDRPLDDLQQQLAPAMARLHLAAQAPAVLGQRLAVRSAERSVGKGCGRQGRSRWRPYTY